MNIDQELAELEELNQIDEEDEEVKHSIKQKNQLAEDLNNKWYKFNDTTVEEINLTENFLIGLF